jgi:hypothetical protein
MEAVAEETPDASLRASARFVLDVWDSHKPTRAARFDLMEAMRVWDDDHRQALDVWVNCPNYPEPGVPIHLRRRPRHWTASEAINTLWDYLETFQVPTCDAAERLSDLDEELLRLEEQEAERPVDA